MNALTAAGAGVAPLEPPADWFENPHLDAPTPLTVTADGQVFGHLAAWGTCHVAKSGCVTPPRSRSGYRFFHLGAITAGGREVEVGQLVLGTEHARLAADAHAAADHYANTGHAVADVRVGEDGHGIWVAGAVRPDIDPATVRQLKAAKLSGDWRTIRGRLELVGALCVNVPGFPIPRTQYRLDTAALTASGHDGDERLALVASCIVDDLVQPRSPLTDDVEYQRRIRVLAARAGGIEALAALAERSRA